MSLQELVDSIYLAMGLDSNTIPQSVVEAYILLWQDTYPDSDCQVMYNTILSLYSYLIKNASSTASGGGKIREKEGEVEIELDGVNKGMDWTSAREEFLKNPWSALPQCRVEFGKTVNSKIIIGGVRRDEVERVQGDDNSYSQYSERSPFSPRRSWCRSRRNINKIY